MDAQSKVFGTYELLETILHFLPFRDLLLTQLVCVQFRELVTSSVKIRKKLHLVPDADGGEMAMAISPHNIELFTSIGTATRVLHGHMVFTEERSTGSWRDMYPFQPPATIFYVRIWHEPSLVFRRADGRPLTLGMLADAICAHIDPHSQPRWTARFWLLGEAALHKWIKPNPHSTGWPCRDIILEEAPTQEDSVLQSV